MLKKGVLFLLLLSLSAGLFCGCSPKEPVVEFDGVVLTKSDASLLLEGMTYCERGKQTTAEEWEKILPGDTVTVGCSGDILESYPSHVAETYYVKLKEEGEVRGLPRIVRIGKALYADTGKTDETPRCGVADGTITAGSGRQQYPNAEEGSNFGVGYTYQIAGKETVRVCIDGSWQVFELLVLDEDLAWHIGLTEE